MCDSNPSTPGRWAWLKRFLPTNWRAFIAWAITLFFVYVGNCIREHNGDEPLPLPVPPVPIFPEEPFGWRPPTEDERNQTLHSLETPQWSDTEAANAGDGPDEDAPVWRLYAKVNRTPFPAQDQGPIGACVAFGSAAACEFSLSAKIHLRRGPPQQFAPNLREAIYAGSRINVDPRNPIRGGDGTTGARASRWLQKGTGGLLPSGSYAGRELSGYDPRRCREWGNRGLPDDLVKACQENSCQTTLVTTAADARKALQQGYAIFVCSDVGFGAIGNQQITRDSDGFLRPNGQWMHCMCIAGYQGGKRPGFLIVNSWGSRWLAGPPGKFSDIPDGAFWADFTVVDRMLMQGDSYAVAGVEGFRRRKIDPSDWIVSLPFPNSRRLGHAFLASSFHR
jgi:hypothetical protein